MRDRPCACVSSRERSRIADSSERWRSVSDARCHRVKSRRNAAFDHRATHEPIQRNAWPCLSCSSALASRSRINVDASTRQAANTRDRRLSDSMSTALPTTRSRCTRLDHARNACSFCFSARDRKTFSKIVAPDCVCATRRLVDAVREAANRDHARIA